MKSLDKAKQQHKVATAGKRLIRLLPAVLLYLLFPITAQAQKLVINCYGFKLAAEDTVSLSKLVRYEAFVYNGLFDKVIPDSLPVVVNIYKSRSEFIKVRDELHALVTKTVFIRAQPANVIYIKEIITKMLLYMRPVICLCITTTTMACPSG